MGDANPLDLPWTARPESHLGDPAWSLIDCYGNSLAVGLRKIDAEAIVKAMNPARPDEGKAQ